MVKLCFIVFFAALLLASASPLSVEQGRFDVSSGWQTRMIQPDPATNYFAVRSQSTNYIWINSQLDSFTTESGFNVTNDWYGGSRPSSASPIAWQQVTVSNVSVVHLSSNSGSFSLQFTNLWPGVYGVQIFGVVTGTVPELGLRPPLKWKIEANDAADGSTNTYTIDQNYITNRNYDIGIFFVQAIRADGPSNNILATVSLSPHSLMSCKVAALHFFAPVDWSQTNQYKTRATLFTAVEQAARVAFGLTNTADATVLGWLNNSPALPTLTEVNKTNTFNNWPPLNVQYDEQSGFYITNASGSVDWHPQPYFANYQNYFTDYNHAWGYTNIVTLDTFSLSDYLTGQPVTEANDLTGFYWSTDHWVSSFGSRQWRYYADRSSIVMNKEGYSLPLRYYTFPSQTNAAHTAALMLAKLALHWNADRREVSDMNIQAKNPDLYLGYVNGRWAVSRPGKLIYYDPALLVQGLDWLWPYVSTSSAFATDLTSFVPWVGGNTNKVQRFFESHLLRGIEFDRNYRVNTDPMQLGVAMQSGSTASNLMNPSVATLDIDPAAVQNSTWRQHYAGSYNKEGFNLIASSYYIMVENYLLNGPDLTRRYLANGGQIGASDITDTSKFPKLAAFVDSFVNMQVGYGYSCSFGDAGMSINEGPGVENGATDDFLINLWRLQPNARLGKYIVDVRGRTTQTDGEWISMQAQSAATVFDLRYPTHSRIFGATGVGILEQGLGTTNQIQRGALVLRTVSGSGHDHGDHLDLNIYAIGSRMGTDFAQRNEGVNYVLPRATATRVHNVVEVDGYNHDVNSNNGWPGGNTEAGFSQYTAFSTNGSAQMIGADLWNGGYHTNISWQHRDSVLVRVDATNSYVVDFQRVHGGRFHSWSFHGADVGGETSGFTISETLTNVTDFTDTTDTSPGFFMRKHATNETYGVKSVAMSTNKVWAEWRLGRTATAAGSVLNYDGNGGSVTAIAPEQAMFGSSYSAGSARKFIRATLFDRTNDIAGVGWAFSPNYHILQPRLYVFTPGTTYFTNLSERSGTWSALYDPYLGTRVVTSETSLPTDSALTNAFMPKVIEVATSAGTDRHYSSGTNLDVVAGGDTFNGKYGFRRGATEFKLVGAIKLTGSGFSLIADTNNVSVTISSVNYTNRTLTTTAALPVRRTGWYRIRNATHETSYYITAWTSSTNASFTGDPLCGELDVSIVSGNTVTLTSAAGGMVLANYPKRGTGVSAQNESRSKTLKVDYAASTTAIRISGDTVVTGDFTDADGDGHVSMWLYDFGPGDTLEEPSEVYVKQNAGGFTVAANVGFTFSGIPNGYQNSGNIVTNGIVPASFLTGQPQDFDSGGITIDTANIGTFIIGP